MPSPVVPRSAAVSLHCVSDERSIGMATPAEMARLVQDAMLYKA